MKYIHIYDFPYKVSISVKEDFLNSVREKFKIKYKKLKNGYDDIEPNLSFSRFKSIMSPSSKYFIPLQILIGICSHLEIPLKELEQSILAYRTKGGRSVIYNPILPVKVNPIFSMLVAHIIGDGNCVKLHGREMYFNYRQYDKKILSFFIKKIGRVFGDIKFNENYFFSLKRVYLPTIISLILGNYYSLKPENFLSDRAFIPQKMFTLPREHLLAVLIALIIDEGTIGSSEIVIGLYNKKLIDDLGKVCKKLCYECSIGKGKNGKRHFLYILSNGTKKFWKDYLSLKRKYPEVFLCYKEDQIRDFILRKEKYWRSKSQGITKNSIIDLLKKKPRTTKELAKILLISKQGIRFHLKELEKIGIVKKIGKGRTGSDVYNIIKICSTISGPKGRSRQYGVTIKRITKLLEERGKLDTRDLAGLLNMKRNTILNFLKKLEKEKVVIRVGKSRRMHPSIIWSLFSRQKNNLRYQMK